MDSQVQTDPIGTSSAILPQAPPTLDDLAGVPLQKLDKPCSDEHLITISPELPQWRTVAPHLGLKEGDIEEIERDARTESEKRLKALQKWKNKFGSRATHRVLIEALLNCHMANHAEKVCHLLTAIPQVPRDDPKPVHDERPASSSTADNTPTTVNDSVQKEIHELEKQYDNLVDVVEDSLTNTGTDLSQLKKRIIRLPVSLKYSHWEFHEPESIAAIENTTSIRELFTLLHNRHWDFLNCDLLCHIVDRFGDPNTRESREKYLHELGRFRKKTKLIDLIQWTSTRYAINESLEKHLVLKLGEEWRDQTLEELEQFKTEFSRRCSIEKHVMQFRKAEGGCIAVTFALPASVDIAALCLQDLREFLKQHHVLRIMAGESCILDVTTIPKVGVEQTSLKQEGEQQQPEKTAETTALPVKLEPGLPPKSERKRTRSQTTRGDSESENAGDQKRPRPNPVIHVPCLLLNAHAETVTSEADSTSDWSFHDPIQRLTPLRTASGTRPWRTNEIEELWSRHSKFTQTDPSFHKATQMEEGSTPGVRPSLQLALEVKPWQPVIIPPCPGALASSQEEDIHLVIHMPRRHQVLDMGASRTWIKEEYPSLYDLSEPNVLGRLDQLGIQPRIWNPWIKVIGVEDIMVAVCKCYETEPWVQEKIELTQDDINSIESWTKDRWKFSYSRTGKLYDLRDFVIHCLICTEGRGKLKTLIEATSNGSTGSSNTLLSILDLSELPVKKWYPVGLGLGVKEDNLYSISKKFLKKEECVVCMFDDWLRNHAREACYPPMKLVAVLLDAGEMESARMVCEQYDICEPRPPVLPTLQDLCLLPLVDNEWREVGEQLGVSDDDLEIAAESDDPQREMFRRCLEREKQRQAVPFEQRLLEALSRGPELAETVSSPELAELTKALYAVGDPELAEKIIQEHKVRVLNIPHPAISSYNEHLKIHWQTFGKSLGFNVQDIEGKHSEIFEEWLKRNPNATYDKLVSDLSVIGDHKGARTVCRKFGVRLPDASVVALYDRKTITRQPQVQKSTSKEGPARNVGKDEKPTLPLLLKFPKGSNSIDIPQRIGNCSDFGIFLLDDETGAIVEAINEKHRGNIKEINMTILQEWLKGRGREPFTWETLVKVLRDADLSTLADDIEHEL